MFPILLQLDPVIIYSLWTSLTIGLLLSLLVIYQLTPLRKSKINFIADHSLFLILSTLIGSRLIFVLLHYDYYLLHFDPSGQWKYWQLWEIINIRDMGLSAWGAVLGLIISLVFLSKRYQENFANWADIFTPALVLIITFANFGAFLDGRNYGTPTDLPWGITLLNSQFATPIHPVQLYATLYSLGLFIFLLCIFNLPFFKKPGAVALCGLTLFSFLKFFEEFIRGDETTLIYDIRLPQIICFFLTLVAAYFTYRLLFTKPKPNNVTPFHSTNK